MHQAELLELQSTLISYLTDPRAFGELKGGTSEWEMLAGIDPGRMAVLGWLAQDKRISKVVRLLPRTCMYLGPALSVLSREFAIRHPPLYAGGYANACQFYMLLRRSWRARPPDPPFLPDLAYCELAMVSVGRAFRPEARSILSASTPSTLGPLLMRRRPGVHLRRCQYNIQPLLEFKRRDTVDVVQQPVCVILSRPLNTRETRVFQVDEGVFELVLAWKSWRMIEPRDGLFDNEQTVNLLRTLEELGILEVRLCESA